MVTVGERREEGREDKPRGGVTACKVGKRERLREEAGTQRQGWGNLSVAWTC